VPEQLVRAIDEVDFQRGRSRETISLCCSSHHIRVLISLASELVPRQSPKVCRWSPGIAASARVKDHHASWAAIAHPLPRCISCVTILANCTDSLIVAVSLGEGLIGSPRSLIAATRQAAMSSAPAWRSGSMREAKYRRTKGEKSTSHLRCWDGHRCWRQEVDALIATAFSPHRGEITGSSLTTAPNGSC